MLRRFAVLCLLFLVPAVVVAQEAYEETGTLFLYVEWVEGIGGDEDDPLGLPTEILTALDVFFAESELDVTFLHANDAAVLAERVAIFDDLDDHDSQGLFAPSSQIISLRFENYGPVDAVRITPFSGYVRPPLPTRSFGWTVAISLGGDNSGEIDDVVNAVAGVGGYVAQACDFALPYIEALAADTALAEDGLFVDVGFSTFMGSCLYFTDDLDGAIAAYETVVAYEGENDQVNARAITVYTATNLAWMYAQRGDVEDAVEILDAYSMTDFGGLSFDRVTFTGRELQGGLARANLYAELGEFETALAAFDEMLAFVDEQPTWFGDDEHARIYAERGWLRHTHENAIAALLDFERAIEIDPTYPKTYYYAAVVRESAGEMDLARENYARFLELVADYDGYYEEDLTPFIERAEETLAG